MYLESICQRRRKEVDSEVSKNYSKNLNEENLIFLCVRGEVANCFGAGIRWSIMYFYLFCAVSQSQ